MCITWLNEILFKYSVKQRFNYYDDVDVMVDALVFEVRGHGFGDRRYTPSSYSNLVNKLI